MFTLHEDTQQLPLLLEECTVHCFFHCPYVARSADPQEAHDLMERHYTEKYTKQIEQIVARLK